MMSREYYNLQVNRINSVKSLWNTAAVLDIMSNKCVNPHLNYDMLEILVLKDMSCHLCDLYIQQFIWRIL